MPVQTGSRLSSTREPMLFRMHPSRLGYSVVCQRMRTQPEFRQMMVKASVARQLTLSSLHFVHRPATDLRFTTVLESAVRNTTVLGLIVRNATIFGAQCFKQLLTSSYEGTTTFGNLRGQPLIPITTGLSPRGTANPSGLSCGRNALSRRRGHERIASSARNRHRLRIRSTPP